MSKTDSPSPIQEISPLGFQWQVSDPFLFCVHHNDYYPVSDGHYAPNASLQGRDIGQDFAGIDGWRMYHGEHVPGFPEHPHRGFETVTVVQKGVVDHADSMGAAGRYADGDVQWMTAGSGVQHSEMFPLIHADKENTMELFQIWLNLPAKNKMVKPHFTMHWNEKIPVLSIKDSQGNLNKLKIIAGAYQETKGLPPPPNSWAADSEHQVWIWIIDMQPHAEFTIPAAKEHLNRNVFYFEGNGLSIQQQTIPKYHQVKLASHLNVTLKNGSEPAKLLLLQGQPIAEPTVQYGPFVMNTKEEIQQAFLDFRATQFGGWPWKNSDPIHNERGRFARHADGHEEFPV